MLGQLGDVNEPLDAGHDLNEGAKRDHLGDLAVQGLAGLVAVKHTLPRVFLGLLQAK